MSPGRKRLLYALKALLAVVILVAVGWWFARLLADPSLTGRTAFRIGYLIPAGLLYLACHTLWGTFWWQLLRGQGVAVSWFAGVRAYFVSQIGKYVPGKAWVLVLRVLLLRGTDVRPTVVLVTGVYETLTNMAAGAVLGVCLLPWSGLADGLSELQRYGLFGLTLMPLVLLGLNRLVRRVANKYRGPDAPAVPVPSLRLLAQGMAQATVGWCLLGLSLWLTTCGLCTDPPPLSATTFLQDLSGVSLAYVIGFVVLVSPAGVGAREWALQTVLERQLAVSEPAAGPVAAAVALALRVVWTAFEVVAMAGLFLAPLSPWGEGGQRGGFRVTSDSQPQSPRPAPVAGVLSLVVPVFNERESLAPLSAEIAAVAMQMADWRFEVVFVDDGSTDGSWQEVRKLAEADGRVRGVKFRRNFGKAAALAAGFREATGEIVLTLDADLQDDPAEIPRFVDAIRGGLDVASGFKQVRHDPWHKVFPSRVFNRLVSGLTGVTLRDHNCGFKAYRAEVVRSVRLYGELHRFVPVLAAEKGYRVGELVIHHRPRKYGRSKYGWRRFTRGFLDLISVQFLTGYGDRPQHFLGRLGLVPLALGFLGLLVLVANWLLRLIWPDAGGGQFSQLIGAVFTVGLLLFGSQLVIAGLLAELVVDRDPSQEPPYSIQDRTPPAANP